VNTSNSKRAISLIPLGYLLVTRANNVRDLGYLVATSWIPAWWLIVRLGGLDPLLAMEKFAAGYFAFICAYELGYLVNDGWDARNASDGRQRLTFAVTPSYLACFILIRVGLWTATALQTGWLAELSWLVGFIWLLAAFAEHNLLRSSSLRVASFVQLASLRFLLPIIAVIPTGHWPAAGAAALLFYVYPRTLSYMDSKALLQLHDRSSRDFAFRQTLVLMPAVVALSLIFDEPALFELLFYFVGIHFLGSIGTSFQPMKADRN
jgi:hypothetical protein